MRNISDPNLHVFPLYRAGLFYHQFNFRQVLAGQLKTVKLYFEFFMIDILLDFSILTVAYYLG